jgi:hypothetical protein
MNEHKYVALDVDSANIVAGVYDSKGREVMESHIRTERKTIEQFFRGLSGRLHVNVRRGNTVSVAV